MNSPRPIYQEISLHGEKRIDPNSLRCAINADRPTLILLAAGKGTRFGTDPKCIAPVRGKPLARHSIDAFRQACRLTPCSENFSGGAGAPDAAVVAIVGYQHEQVTSALGDDNIYVLSDSPTGGTAWAVYESFCVAELLERNPILVISMGDRVVPAEIFEKLLAEHRRGPREADLTILTARYDAARIRGKGRVVRDENHRVIRIVEERDILSLSEGEENASSVKASGSQNLSKTAETDLARELSVSGNRLAQSALLSLTEGNCPLYVIRAAKLMHHLMLLSNNNAQRQYYLTDIVERIAESGCDVRSLTVEPSDAAFEILCADVTRPEDLPKLEKSLERFYHDDEEVASAAEKIRANRPAGQVASIARQFTELNEAIRSDKLLFDAERPFGIGVAGGRFRIAFMHPDMGRFFAPAWQAPLGAERREGTEQITLFVQETDDRRLHLHPLAKQYRESLDFIPSDTEEMFPDESVSDGYSYEEFGTRMSQRVLLSLGYFSDGELERRRCENVPLPPESLWVSNNMRRPFSLVGNAIASLRTYREGAKGKKIADRLGKNQFRGLSIASTGLMPQGGFSCSSALTIAAKNALDALYQFGLTDDEMIRLAAQAEYGTGVRAGSLDQATIQTGRPGIGTLISSSPRDRYAVLGTFRFPSERIVTLFPYTAARDSQAFRFSAGFYAASAGTASAPASRLTAAETRLMTGKSAEIAALLLRRPLDEDFFESIRGDLLDDGELTDANRRKIADELLALPLWIEKAQLEERAMNAVDFYASELVRCENVAPAEAESKACQTVRRLFTGWRNPLFRVPTPNASALRGCSERSGIPLRALLAYLYAETAKNFYLIHHSDRWIENVRNSQRGDRCFEIGLDAMPSKAELETTLDWERGADGSARVERWLDRLGAQPFDFNRGLDDETLGAAEPPVFYRMEGTNFFRGLALIDLAEAFLRRAFGDAGTAVRVNAAGQGDYFQVHVDRNVCSPDDVKRFLDDAYYRRFQINVENRFIEVHAGGGALGVRLSRYSLLGRLIDRLENR